MLKSGTDVTDKNLMRVKWRDRLYYEQLPN
jgi:hypothetical protein